MSQDEIRPCREKYWSEINDEEKVERLRKEVKLLRRQAQEFKTTLLKLREHGHDMTGKPTIPLISQGGHGFIGQQVPDGDDVYF